MPLKHLAVIAVSGLVVLAGSAVAQEVYLEGEPLEAPPPVAVVPVPIVRAPIARAPVVRPPVQLQPQLRYEPRVYGWSAQVYGWGPARNGDCGTFGYWTGSRCADARYEPPPR